MYQISTRPKVCSIILYIAVFADITARGIKMGLKIIFSILLAVGFFTETLRAQATTMGEQKTAVILVNFEDAATQQMSAAAAHTLVFGTVSNFYWEGSYQ